MSACVREGWHLTFPNSSKALGAATRLCHLPFLPPSPPAPRTPQLTWSQRAICRVFHLETPVVRSRFMFPRNTTRFTLWFLQLASWGDRASR